MVVISSVIKTINESSVSQQKISNYYSIPLSHIVEYPFERTGFVVVSILMRILKFVDA